jgi:DNA polymerase V
MQEDQWHGAAYKGTKTYNQWELPTANATGFGAAADDYTERGIDLNEELISNKPATFFFRMNSDAMMGVGIFSGDVLVVDRSIKALNGKIIVAMVNGEFLVRRLQKNLHSTVLLAENKKFADIPLANTNDSNCVWGVVTYSIHSTL